MAQLTRDQVNTILKNAPAGVSKTTILDGLIKSGHELEGVDTNKAKAEMQARGNYTPPVKTEEPTSTYGSRLADSYTKAGERITSGIKTAQSEFNKGTENVDPNTGIITPSGVLQAGKAAIRGVGRVLGTVAGATAEPLLQTEPVQNTMNKVGQAAMSIEPVQSIAQKVSALSQKYPEISKDLEDIINIATVGTGKTLEKPVANIIKNTADEVSSGVVATGKNITNLAKSSGVGQIGQEIAERVPRAVGKAKEKVVEAGIRAEKIKNASPVVAEAIKTNLDDRIINTVAQADDETKNAFMKVLDIADETPNTIGMKKQPSLVGGELAVSQYDLINKQKKLVGEKIGDITKNLSKTEKINMQDSFGQMDDILSNQGIVPQYSKKGVKLDFTGSKYTPAERTKIQELYNLATEGGDTLSPLQIKSKDQLFSKLKRESNFEGIGDLIIETQDGNKSLFNVFRDIYSSKLDTLTPELKKLNNSYRSLSQITDDIEDSIFKTPNFNVTKSVDPAEFAKVNMRRIFGEAQSSPVFEAVVDVMDKASRGLGYKGATPKQVAEFAEYIRKLYPESIPKTGFQGGIKAGMSDIIEKVTSMGIPDITDQRKALRGLLENKKK